MTDKTLFSNFRSSAVGESASMLHVYYIQKWKKVKLKDYGHIFGSMLGFEYNCSLKSNKPKKNVSVYRLIFLNLTN